MNRRRVVWWAGCFLFGALWSLPKTVTQIAAADDPDLIARTTLGRWGFGWLVATVIVEIALRIHYAWADRKRSAAVREQ